MRIWAYCLLHVMPINGHPPAVWLGCIAISSIRGVTREAVCAIVDVIHTTALHTTCCTLGLHVAFYSKIPCYPLHVWLMEAHVEGTTDASVLLAGIYLKIGIQYTYRYEVTQSLTLPQCDTPYMVAHRDIASYTVYSITQYTTTTSNTTTRARDGHSIYSRMYP